MKRTITFALVLAAATLVSSVADAHSRFGRTERREALQRARIHAGWRQHDLTRREMWRLRSGQWRIDRMQRRSWRDGRIDRFERRRLERMQDVQSRRIHRLRHNDRERWL